MGRVLWGVGLWGSCKMWPWDIECLVGTKGGDMGKGGILYESCTFEVVPALRSLLVEIVFLKKSPRLENRSRRRQWWCTGDLAISRRCF